MSQSQCPFTANEFVNSAKEKNISKILTFSVPRSVLNQDYCANVYQLCSTKRITIKGRDSFVCSIIERLKINFD